MGGNRASRVYAKCPEEETTESGELVFKFLKRKKTKQGEVYEVQLPDNLLSGKLDVNSSTWAFIARWANDNLESSRERNDLLSLDDKKRYALIGKIKLLKEILRLPEINK